MTADHEAQGLGLAKLATARLVDEALGPWSLHEVFLECFESNRHALEIYEVCGFLRSGIRMEPTVRMAKRREGISR